MLFLTKLISVLKNKLLIIENMLNIKKIILFKVIMQKQYLIARVMITIIIILS